MAASAPVAWSAENTPPPPRPFTLAMCITEALEHNFDIRIERYEPALARRQIRLAQGDYDPTFSLGAASSHEVVPGGLDAALNPYRSATTTTDSIDAGFKGQLPFGLTYNLAATAREAHGDRLNNNAPPAYLSSDTSSGRATYLDLRMPILKNLLIDASRYNVQIRRQDLKISELALRYQIMTTVANVEQAYFELQAARENVRVQEKALELARTLYEENHRREQIGTMEPLDVQQAQSQMASSESALLEARRALATQRNTLINLMSDRFEDWGQAEILPTDSLLVASQTFAPKDSWTAAFQNRPDLHELILDLERRHLTTRYQRNQLFPQIDLTATYGHAASSREFAGVFDQFGRGTFPFYSYGVAASFPLGNRRARENYEISKQQKEQAEERLKQARQTIMVDVDNAILQASTRLAQTRATREAREYAETALDAGNKKLASGKIRSFEVLQLQRDMTAARSDEIRAIADYNKALSTLRLREGTTLRERNIDVDSK